MFVKQRNGSTCLGVLLVVLSCSKCPLPDDGVCVYRDRVVPKISRGARSLELTF